LRRDVHPRRIQLEVDDLAREVKKLRMTGVRFRSDIVTLLRRQADPAGRPCRELYRVVRTSPGM